MRRELTALCQTNARPRSAPQSHPFSRSAGCEPNRARHPLAGRCRGKRVLMRRELTALCQTNARPRSAPQSHPFSRSAGCEPNRARHPSGSSEWRCSLPAPWRPLPPQRNVGAKPCPRDCSQEHGLPLMAPILGWLAAWAIGRKHVVAKAQRPINKVGFAPVTNAGSLRLAEPLSKASPHVERFVLAQHVVTGARELVRQRLGCHDGVGPRPLAFVEAFRLGAEAPRELRRLDECPGEVRVAVL